MSDPSLKPPEALKPPEGDPSPIFSTKHAVIYVLLLAALIGLFTAGILYFRQEVDVYQHSQDRYAAERGLKALAKLKTPGAGAEAGAEVSREVGLLLGDLPIHRGLLGTQVDETWEGAVRRNRVMILEQFAAGLLGAGRAEEAEAVAWKSVLEYHIPSRILELINSWELMYYIKGKRQGWDSAFEISKILAAHGASAIRQLKAIDPIPYDVAQALFKNLPASLPPDLITGLSVYYQSTTPEDYQVATKLLIHARATSDRAAVKHKLAGAVHRALIEGGQRAEARKFFAQVWGRDPAFMDSFWNSWPGSAPGFNLTDRDPALLEMMWLDRPSTATMPVNAFLQSFSGDPRLRVLDFKNLNRKAIGYFNLNNKLYPTADSMILPQSIAATMQVQATQAVHRIYLAYEARPALGLYPILLMRVDNEPYAPIYCDSATPSIVSIDCQLEPGIHNFDFVYLNDAGFNYPRKGIAENRDLILYRMALLNVPTAE